MDIMEIRKPIVAGQFYSGSNQGCLQEVQECLEEAKAFKTDLPDRISGGVVPHAGWVFSGDLAAAVFSAIKQADENVDTFVIFGAVHSYVGPNPVIYSRGKWKSPLGEIDIDEDLADEIASSTSAISDNLKHISEHSIEVQVPFIQSLFPNAKIVPIMVSPSSAAVEFGSETGEVIKKITSKKIVCIASTDLTHYGPRYGFFPEGAGDKGIEWAKNVNDQNFIDLAVSMKPDQLLESGESNMSACGPGAVAALVAAMKEIGKSKGILLGHTHSNDVMMRKYHQSSEESVGYAGIVY